MSTKTERNEQLAQIKEEFAAASALYFTGYEGMTVEAITEVRANLRNVGAKYIVVKNTLARIALEGMNVEGISSELKGPIGVVVATTDATAPAKVIKNYNKDNSDKMPFKAGYLDGTVFIGEDVNKLADLASREDLYSMLLSCLQAPITKMAGTLNGILTNFVRTVDAVREQKDS